MKGELDDKIELVALGFSIQWPVQNRSDKDSSLQSCAEFEQQTID